MGILDEIVDDITDKAGPGAQDSILVKRAVEMGVKEGLKVAPGSWGAMKVCPLPLHHSERCIQAFHH